MEIQLQYWHWLVFGMLLCIAELLIPSFMILWFGLGAVVVAILLLPLPNTSVTTQLFLWAISSLLFTFAWFKLLRPIVSGHTQTRTGPETVRGESGTVIRPPDLGEPGIVRFTTPLLGSDEWPFVCDQPVALGDRVFVKEVSEKMLIVETRTK